jgi:AraC-like DNA-binding protein
MADSNWAVLYQPDQDYRRHLVHPAGDVCAFVEIGPALLADLVAESDDVAAVFAAGRAPVPASAWLQVQLAVAADGDRVATESRVIDAVGQVVRGASRRTPGRRRPPSSPTVGYRVRRRIEDACELLASDLDQQLSLTDLARRLQVSPYHLARQFRERTGRTVHAYREQARLRAAGSAFLTRPDTRLAELAASLGFSSHSHLTTRFSRAFGLPPSRLRALAGAHVTT